MRAWLAMQRVAAAGLLPLLVIAGVAAILIRARSAGPIMYRATREGYKGRHFRMWKLRTMVANAEECLQRHLSAHPDAAEEWRIFGRLQDDPRIPGRIAMFVRRYSIDELPQLFNVLAGEMNLVGPRPLPLDVADGLRPSDRAQRRTMRPGMTGLWQVTGRSERSISAMGRIDSLYARQHTVALDLWILLETPVAVWRARGSY
ncbi:MAG: sugar transferase, partial [Candidatus Hydrogenedentes bacterium]|nr:sugar transferase [Candidatus Hydrogenedentota bacterium]